MFKLQGRTSACTTCAGSSEILRWLTPFLGPNMDPKMGSRIGSHLQGLLGPVLGSRFGRKSGVSHQILLLPAEVLQADLRRTSMSVSVNTCFFSLCVPLAVDWAMFLGPLLGGAPRLTEACPRHAWQELLWKKPPLRTSTCGRHRFRRNHPLYGNLECGRATSGRRDLMGSHAWQGQVWKEAWKPQVGRRELRNTKASPRKGRKRQKTPFPHTMCHTPHWASAGRVAFYYFVFLKRRKCIRGHFLVVFGIHSGPSQGFSRIHRGIRRHPRVRSQICESTWLVFRTLPYDVAASVDRNSNILSKIIRFLFPKIEPLRKHFPQMTYAKTKQTKHI